MRWDYTGGYRAADAKRETNEEAKGRPGGLAWVRFSVLQATLRLINARCKGMRLGSPFAFTYLSVYRVQRYHLRILQMLRLGMRACRSLGSNKAFAPAVDEQLPEPSRLGWALLGFSTCRLA